MVKIEWRNITKHKYSFIKTSTEINELINAQWTQWKTPLLWSQPNQENKKMATKSNLPPLFLLILILIITLTSSHKVFAFEDGYKFLKKLDKDVQINWVVNKRKEERSCNNLSSINKDLINKVVAHCKIIREENIDPTDNNDSSYLMDSIGHAIYAKYFDPISIIDFGREYGISLSRRRESEILLLVDENGEFRESYAISGYIVNTTNAQKKWFHPILDY